MKYVIRKDTANWKAVERAWSQRFDKHTLDSLDFDNETVEKIFEIENRCKLVFTRFPILFGDFARRVEFKTKEDMMLFLLLWS